MKNYQHVITTKQVSAKVTFKHYFLALGCLALVSLPPHIPAQAYLLNNLNRILSTHGEEVFQNITELNEIVMTMRNASDAEKLEAINNFFNSKLQYVDDQQLWRKSDYWATPLESMSKKAGDCEDFAIAKYSFLKTLQVPNDKLRLTYVRAASNQNLNAARAHMVLSYYPNLNKEPLILDNLTPEILPASERPDLKPIYSFNDKSLWVGSSTSPKAKSQTHLSKWRDLLKRMRQNTI